MPVANDDLLAALQGCKVKQRPEISFDSHIDELLWLSVRPWRVEDKCRFCGLSQVRPSEEKHWKYCPRLLVVRWFGHENLHVLLREVDTKDINGPFLYDWGPDLLRVLSEVIPEYYSSYGMYIMAKKIYEKEK